MNAPEQTSGSALDPVYRSSEVIFGLLMAMSFIGSISVATDGQEEVRTLLIAALGCNLAWGLVDAVMHLVGTKTQKRRNFMLLGKLRGGADAAPGASPRGPRRRSQACGGSAATKGWSRSIRPSLLAPPGEPSSSKNSTFAL